MNIISVICFFLYFCTYKKFKNIRYEKASDKIYEGKGVGRINLSLGLRFVD